MLIIGGRASAKSRRPKYREPLISLESNGSVQFFYIGFGEFEPFIVRAAGFVVPRLVP
jgi:hypothetical protein